ncbi:MAG: monovalent cation/H+ antiporter subunit D family protein [Firmicutes bacterium]|nr:monovalent cation/H+ antiporter subunit D family protein [Bacillota bacterium]
MPTGAQLLIGAVIFPIGSALLLSLFPERSDKARNYMSVFIAAVTAAMVVMLLVEVLEGRMHFVSLITILPGLDLSFRADPFSVLFGALASILWVFTVIYSTGYMAHENNRRRYFVYFLISLGTTMGIAFSANLFTLYLFYEFLTIFTYPLVIHTGTREAHQAGLRYIVYSFVGAAFALSAIVMTYSLAGTLDFGPGGIVQPEAGQMLLWQLIFICFIIGFGVKAAIMPLHAWLPAAMVAPTPVSALLHAVAVVKSGVFSVLRVMYSVYGKEALSALNLRLFVLILVSATILIASIIALRQDVLKRRLAYSTISQLSYIILGAGLLTSLGLSGGLLHLLNHAMLKITLFFCAGAIITVTGKEKISELAGVGRQMPLTMLAFSVCSIGMIGIPPTNGFISKLFLMDGSLDVELPAIIVVLITSALLNAAYFIPIIITAFFKPGNFKRAPGAEAPLSMLVPIIFLALLCLVAGIKLDLTVPFIQDVVAYLF